MRITEMIHSGAFGQGHQLPSERNLAKELAVSRGVVRLALKELASHGLIESKTNCRPIIAKPNTREPNQLRSIRIWLWPNMADFAAASIMKGIQGAGLDESVRLVVGHAPGGNWDSIYEAERRFLSSLASETETFGVIVWLLGHHRSFEALRALREKNVPMVFIDRLPPAGIDSDYVGTNNESAARTGVRHLLGLGHRRVALLTNIDTCSAVRERESGYRRALADYGVPLDENLILRDSIDEPEGVEQLVESMLSLKERPTAVFCINDHLALQVQEALTTRNIQIPERMSVLGFDGLLRWVPRGGSLTTLNQDFERMGQLAAELVIERMTGSAPSAYKHYLLDAPLADNGSTAPPAISLPSNGGILR